MQMMQNQQIEAEENIETSIKMKLEDIIQEISNNKLENIDNLSPELRQCLLATQIMVTDTPLISQ